MFCPNCGKEVKEGEVYCQNCGTKLDFNSHAEENSNNTSTVTTSSSSASSDINSQWLVALLLCILLGGIGAHRFAVGKIGTGILWLFTFGMFGIGVLIDFILIVCQQFTDAKGNVLRYHN